MLPIPKELQNQKAIPFMEWCEKELQDKNAGAVVICDYNYTGKDYVPSDDLIVLDFYNQPFTPEMLQEYFENWSEWTGRIDVQVNKFSNLLIIGRYEILDDSEIDIIKFYTLNDLITLCTLAGVELTWKGQTE